MSCPVHPYATGGEVKTIGLFPVEGMTEAQVYSRWALGNGWRCTCSPESVLVQAYDGAGQKVGEPYETKLVTTTPGYTVRVTGIGEWVEEPS